MLLVDVHTHLEHVDFKNDLDKVIQRAKQAGVKTIISNGINPETNRLTLEIAKKYDIVKAALGIYPIDALQKESEIGEFPLKPNVFDLDKELNFIEKNKQNIVAIGEIGLDFKYSNKKNEQKEVFKKMLNLAEKLNKPVIVHSRSAELECVEILQTTKLKKILLHCFNGKLTLVKKAIDNGWFFSIPTNIVRSQQFQKMTEITPLPQIFTETDAPYLSPFRGTRNESSFIIETIKEIAKIKNLTQEEVANNIYMNYKRVFENC